VVPGVLSQTQGVFRQYGLFGDLVHVASVGALFAGLVYVLPFDMSSFTLLTKFLGSLPSANILWTATRGSARRIL